MRKPPGNAVNKVKLMVSEYLNKVVDYLSIYAVGIMCEQQRS